MKPQEHALNNVVTPTDVAPCLKPSVLRAQRDFAKGELVLVPGIMGVGSITTTFKPGVCEKNFSQSIGGDNFMFYVTKPPQPSKSDLTKNDVISLFFWVTPVSNKPDANMVLKFVSVSGVSVPTAV